MKNKMNKAMEDYISKVDDRVTFIKVMSIIVFMSLSAISDWVFHSELFAAIFGIMMISSYLTLNFGLKKYIKNIKGLDQWYRGKNEMDKELKEIRSHIQFLKSPEAKATLPVDKIKELTKSYTEAEKVALDGMERCDEIIKSVQGTITRSVN